MREAFPHRKHLSSYPAVKVGRLAVSLNYRKQGIGSDILSAIKQMLINQQSISAMRFLTVDAYSSAIHFYDQNGFLPLTNEAEDDALPMYYDLKSLM